MPERLLEGGYASAGPRVAAVVDEIDLGWGLAVLPGPLADLGRDALLDVVAAAAVVVRPALHGLVHPGRGVRARGNLALVEVLVGDLHGVQAATGVGDVGILQPVERD